MLVRAGVRQKHGLEDMGDILKEGQHKKARVDAVINDIEEGNVVKVISGSMV